MLEEVLEENAGIAVAFMGLFDTYENRVNGYERLRQNSINLGKQMMTLAVTECCDLYVNPKRSGGGSSDFRSPVSGNSCGYIASGRCVSCRRS